MGFQRQQVKLEVKQAMRLTRPRPIWITLLYLVIVGIISNVVSSALTALSGGASLEQMMVSAMMNGEDMEEMMESFLFSSYGSSLLTRMTFVGMLGSLVIGLWQSLMGTGYSDYCLSMARNEAPPLEGLFRVFPQWTSIVITHILVGVFVILWSLLIGWPL